MHETWHPDDPRAMIVSVRVPLAVVLIAGAILAMVPQTRDMLADLGDDFPSALAFNAAALAWGLSCWYWSRTALVALHGESMRAAPGLAGTMFAWLPRLVLGFAALVLLSAMLAAGDGARLGWTIAVFLALWSVLLAFVILRTKLFPTEPGEEVEPVPPAPFAAWVRSIPQRVWRLVKAAPSPWWVAVPFALLLPAGFAIWVAVDPLGFARVFAGPAAALLGLAMMVPVATLLVALLDQWDLPLLRRFPALAAVALWSLLVDTPYVDRHPVRVIHPTAATPTKAPAERVTLEEAFAAWLARCAVDDDGAPLPHAPVVIVASAGGASRAALWTTTVLAALEQEAALHRRLFAISAVSGGALGAAVHLAAREEAGVDCRTATLPPKLAERADAAIGRDFLGPPLAAYLMQDTWQLLTGWLQAAGAWAVDGNRERWFVPDRAAALEDAFAAAWRRSANGNAGDAFDRPFLSSWYGPAGFSAARPLLFQNGAEVASGRRIITAPVLLGPRLPPSRQDMDRPAFAAATDHLLLAGADVRLSTSVTNSARFPYLTPAGEVRGTDGTSIQVVDGGYVDNHGARTAWEIADAVERAARAEGRVVTPIIVAITPHGEVALPAIAVPRCDNRDLPAPASRTERQSEVLAPFIGLAGTRAGHTALAIETLRRRFCPSGAEPLQRFFHFYLPARCLASGCEDVPLNWTLSEGMRAHILAQMQDGAGERQVNRSQLAGLRATLTAILGAERGPR